MMQTIAQSGAGLSGASALHMNIFGLNPVVVFGTEEQKRRMLPPLVAGKDKACFAVTEPDAGLDTLNLKTRAERTSSGYVLSGQKIWISTAQVASKMLILARTTPADKVKRRTEGLSLFYTDLDRRHVEVREIEKMGRKAVDSNQVFIDALPVPAEDRIGAEGKGFEYILHGMNPERVLIACEAIGLGRVALERASAYARDRIVFDRPIGKNQSIQHPLAQCWMALEAANLMVFKAASLYDANQPCGAEANAAKYLAGEACFDACQTAVHDAWRHGLRKGISRRALSARSADRPHRAGQPADDPELHRREGARHAEVVLMRAETIAAIVEAHRAGASPEATIARTYARIRERNDPAIFITLRDEADAIAEARALKDKSLPLYGVPFAVKDNIDVAGMPTTAACPAFAYTPKADATCVARLRAAGAIPIGKTNLDQFATGLVGVRSPYGVPRNAFDPKVIPGGSSSGSAVAVAAGLVPLALGTDTAGSGRVPAGLGNIVGLKPSLGVVSTAGVVPACRTLDCVSVFALTVDDAWAAFAAMAGPDVADPYMRDRAAGTLGALPPALRDRRADQGRARLLRRSGLGRAIRGRHRALRETRRAHRRDRHRAVLRDRAAALRRPVGRRALSRGAQDDRVLAGVDASGDARDHA